MEVKPFCSSWKYGACDPYVCKEPGIYSCRGDRRHGVGLEFHEDPFVSYVSPKGSGPVMVPGMVFTLEPMINMGSPEFYVDAKNGWTVYTEDGMPSAQWEVTVAVMDVVMRY